MGGSREKKNTKGGSKGTCSNNNRIRTLADLNRPSSNPHSDSDDDDHTTNNHHQTPNQYYTGGHKSGMLVEDPTKGGNDVDSIFDRARQVGAVERPTENLPPSSSRSFTGTGRLLSGEPVAPSAPEQPEAVGHNIIFWRNGFTVNDGPLRSLDDPENAPFLESITKSECPKELEPVDRRAPVHVNLIRRDEDYREPEVQKVPFQGVGRTLGSTAPVSEPSPSDPCLTSVPTPSVGLIVDPNLPSTSIQLRLADGTRMVAHFNHHHTIGDIRGFIDASRPGGNPTYLLQAMGFPPKPLTDPSQTIEQAGLANSVVIQKF